MHSFEVVQTGGGCQALQAIVGDVCITVTAKDDARLPDAGEPVDVGLYLDDSEVPMCLMVLEDVIAAWKLLRAIKEIRRV